MDVSGKLFISVTLDSKSLNMELDSVAAISMMTLKDNKQIWKNHNSTEDIYKWT